MKVTPAGTCRADGKIYTRLAAYDVPATDTLDISAQAKDGRSIPAKIYETINAKPKGSERIFVVVPPRFERERRQLHHRPAQQSRKQGHHPL